MTLEGHGIGIYQGFCAQDTGYKEYLKDYFDETRICHEYRRDKYWNFLTKNMTTVLIVVIDQILIFINIALIEKIGFSTREIIIRQVCMSIFYSQYFNTGLLLMISNANFKYSFLSFIPLRGRYPELNLSWYQDLGPQLIKTMLIKAFVPYAQMFAIRAKYALGRYMDRKSFDEKDLSTKKVTIQQYIELYAGPELQLHFRYATIMNFTFVSFTYGLVLPIMFPIALVAFINLYIVERYQFAYTYRKPPIMGNDLN